MNLTHLHPKRLLFFLDIWREIDAEAFEYRKKNPSLATSDAIMAATIFSVVAMSLVLQGTYGEYDYFAAIVRFIDNPSSATLHPFLYSLVGWIKPEGDTLYGYLRSNDFYRLFELCYWASWRIFGFAVIPLLVVAVYPRLRRDGLGLSFASFFKHAVVYWILFGIVLVAVFVVSFFEEFNSYYPFYRNAHRSVFEFALWESFYVVQFLTLEFFFRGFMIAPLRKTLGTSAIFAMMIPYVMIHVGKPVLECLGAIIAGLVLGTLAMRTRSIWGGFFLHVGIALSMDLLAIWQVHW